jgi:Domain of unknown function (DUF4430)
MRDWLPQHVRPYAAVLFSALLVIAVGRIGISQANAAEQHTVRLVVDYGDGASKTVANLPWTKGLTVLEAMKEATNRPHGISFGYTGSGNSAMLTKIDDVANQGGGAGKKNWQYWVNGNDVDRSFATFELQPDDTIVWRFTTDKGQ